MKHAREPEPLQDDNRIEGRYANSFKIGHNALEFVFDFGQNHNKDEEMQAHTRIIAHPNYAKMLLETLQESIDLYEQENGVIRDNDIRTN